MEITEFLLRFRVQVYDEETASQKLDALNNSLDRMRNLSGENTKVNKESMATLNMLWTQANMHNKAYIFNLQTIYSWLTRIGGTAMSISFSFFMLAHSINETTIQSEKLEKVIKEANKWMTMFGAIVQIITSILQILTFARLQDAKAIDFQNAALQRLTTAEIRATGAASAEGTAMSAAHGARTGGIIGAIAASALFVAIVLPLLAVAIGYIKNYDIGGIIGRTGIAMVKEGEEVITERERRFANNETLGKGIFIQNLNINTSGNNIKSIVEDAIRMKNRGF